MGHWYKQDGSPMHEVESLAGTMRPTTLRDARKYKLVPSVMSILSIIDKPGLTKWQIEQGIMAALTLGREDGEPDGLFLSRVYEDSRRQVINAGIIGDKVHDACEKHLSGKMIPTEFLPHALAVKDILDEYFPLITDWVTEKSFAHPFGFGGRVDLHSPSTGVIVDFKGKDFCPGESKKLDWEQHYQLGGYQLGLQLPLNWGMNIFFSRTHPGHAVGKVWRLEEMQYGQDVFLATFNLWKVLKKFDPSFVNLQNDSFQIQQR